MNKFIFCFIVYLLQGYSFSSTAALNNSTSHLSVQTIDRAKPQTTISFINTQSVKFRGGHLQGVQYYRHKDVAYYVLSGSSDSFSYYSVVKTGKESAVLSINKILEKPYKHAGGFQIHKNYMAIGIEDNEAKNKSKVFVYEFENPETPPSAPKAIIERTGIPKRATAGCVGITIHRGKVIVIVGDWDSEHLDIYTIDQRLLGQNGVAWKLVATITPSLLDKSDWIDEKWLSYQNINFLNGKNGDLYLAGLTTNNLQQDVIDLYELPSQDLTDFSLKKVYSEAYHENNQTKFLWGAGVYQDSKGSIKIVSCGENILETSVIHEYELNSRMF